MRKITLILLANLIAFYIFALPAVAEGPGTGGRRVRLDDEPAGAYLVRVVTSPTPPRVENLYVEIRLLNASSSDVVTDAEVTVRAQPSGFDASSLEATATHDIAPIPDEYAAHLPVEAAGVWEIQIRIDGPLGPAQVSFLERVSSPTAVGAVLSVGAPVAGLLILGIVFLRLQRKNPPQSGESEGPTPG